MSKLQMKEVMLLLLFSFFLRRGVAGFVEINFSVEKFMKRDVVALKARLSSFCVCKPSYIRCTIAGEI
jgi:hypothetical protein